MGDSWLSGSARGRRVSRQREGTQVDGRGIAAATQTMIEYQQSGFAQALAELAEVLLEYESLPSAGEGFLLGTESQP